jgi:hypothetical protein
MRLRWVQVGGGDDIPADVVLVHGNQFFYDDGRYAYKLQVGVLTQDYSEPETWQIVWQDVKLEAA